jgi:arylsulfatase
MKVILLLVDALRADHLGCYGYERNTSPFIDKIARQGTVFKNALACASFTMPSHKAIFTSVYDSGGNLEKLNPCIETTAEILSKAGIATAAFMSNAVTARQSGLHKGFSFFDEGFERNESIRGEKGRTADAAIGSAAKWIESNAGKNFFCFVQVVDTHGPYTPPAQFIEMFKDELLEKQNKKTLQISPNDLGHKSIPKYQAIAREKGFGQYVARYDAAIRFVDSAVERLWQKLVQLGIAEKTAFIITSDHGESMGEHNWFFCHGIDLHEESIKVPLILNIPGKKAHAIEQQASHLDIAPTILHLFGLPKGRQMQGESLLPLIEGKKVRSEPVFFEMHSDVQSKIVDTVVSCARTNEWKYIETKNIRLQGSSVAGSVARVAAGTRKIGFALIKSSIVKGLQLLPKLLKAKTGAVKSELYDLRSDPFEKNNLAGKKPEIAKELREKLQKWKEQQRALNESLAQFDKKIDMTGQMRERLRKLGYFS